MYCIILYYSILYFYYILHYIISYYIILYYIILYYTILHYIILYHILIHNIYIYYISSGGFSWYTTVSTRHLHGAATLQSLGSGSSQSVSIFPLYTYVIKSHFPFSLLFPRAAPIVAILINDTSDTVNCKCSISLSGRLSKLTSKH